jgi:hypothetical protein
MTDLSKFSVYTIAKALTEQHGFVWDIAFLVAWYSRYDEPPTKSPHQVLAIIQKVKHVPNLSEDDVNELRRKAGR